MGRPSPVKVMQSNQTNINQSNEQNFDEFLAQAYRLRSVNDKSISVNISRNTMIAILLSLLIHAFFFFFTPNIKFDEPPASPPTTIEVSLAQPKAKPLPEPMPELVPESVPEPEKAQPVVKPVKQPKVIAKAAKPLSKPEFAVPEPTPEPKPPTKEPVLDPAKFPDMASYMKAVQASRKGAEYDAARQNAEAIASQRGPSEEQLRDERIKNNFKSGTNGIFEITSKSSRHATFVFKGWTNDYSNARLQYFEVEASTGQDIRLSIIKRMIALIREHYQGDFTWESHRLGRSVTQSARLEDNAGLEDFLMMEFFGGNYRNTQ
jgi:outer membrane biosynthesis protein TonB